jgi:putative transposase
MFLGDDAFVEKHQLRQELLEADVSEIPFQQRSVTVLSLKDSQIQSKTRNDTILKAYQSGCYTMKEISGYCKIHY